MYHFVNGSVGDTYQPLSVRHARGLATKGRSSFVDPFCVVSYASSKFKTSVVHGNRDPVWNEEFSL